MDVVRDITPIQDGNDLGLLPGDHPFSLAHDRAITVSRQRLQAHMPVEFALHAEAPAAPPDALRGQFSVANLLAGRDPWEIADESVVQWLRTDEESPIGMALEASGRPDASGDLLPAPLGHDPLPARSIGRLSSYLDAGWLLAVHGVGDRNPALQLFLEDLERAQGVAATTTLFVGVRTTLGAMADTSSYVRLLLQLGGMRHVAFAHEADDRGHLTMESGDVMMVPTGWRARHEPADAETIHLEVNLSRSSAGDGSGGAPEPAPVWRAWLTSRGVAELGLTTRTLVQETWDQVQVRLALPGGLFSVGDPLLHRYAAGGFEFTTSADHVEAIAALLSADPVSGADHDPLLLEGLLRAGLLTVTAQT